MSHEGGLLQVWYVPNKKTSMHSKQVQNKGNELLHMLYIFLTPKTISYIYFHSQVTSKTIHKNMGQDFPCQTFIPIALC